MKGDLETEVPAFNTNFAALSKLWPELPEKIIVSKLIRYHYQQTSDNTLQHHVNLSKAKT